MLLVLRVLREGPVETVTGGWPAGVGIVLRADVLGATFAAISVGVILVSLVYEVFVGVRSRTFPTLVLFLAAGLSGLFLTGDIFNFYVFFEVSMTAAYVLTGYREQDYQVRGAFIFAVVNLLGSVIFLIAIAALYHVTGTLEMASVAERVREVNPNSLITIATAMFVAFSLKLGLFPFHFWLPAVYVGSHAPVAAILSGALANIGNYGLLRFGGDILSEELALGATAVLVLGSASIIYGALQAISRRDTSEVLAYSAIGQVGYVLVALGHRRSGWPIGGRNLRGRELVEQGAALPRRGAARPARRGRVRGRSVQPDGGAAGRRVYREDRRVQGRACGERSGPGRDPGCPDLLG
jgi:multicomponent Na+:H+ antiporter subunit D